VIGVHLLIAWAFGAGTGIPVGIVLTTRWHRQFRPTVVHLTTREQPAPDLAALRRELARSTRRNGGVAF
jgi:hypothetical protein